MDRLNLRSEEKPKKAPNTVFLVIDTKTLRMSGYDGRVSVNKFFVVPEESTTAEDMKETIKEIRADANLETRKVKSEADQAAKVLDMRFGYADKEVAGWYKKNDVVD